MITQYTHSLLRINHIMFAVFIFIAVYILCTLWCIRVSIMSYLYLQYSLYSSYLRNLHPHIPLDIAPSLFAIWSFCLLYPLDTWITTLRLHYVPSWVKFKSGRTGELDDVTFTPLLQIIQFFDNWYVVKWCAKVCWIGVSW